MAIVVPRILYPNRAAAAAATLTASSEATGFPATNLADQLRSMTWRSGTGFTVDAGVNDILLFRTNDGQRTGHVAPGTYATGTAMATAVNTALTNAGYNPSLGLVCSAWWRSDSATVDATTGKVSQLTDLSGNSRNLTQASSSLQPTYVADAIDGRPGIYFNGTASQRLTSAATLSTLLGANGIGTIVTVVRLDSDATGADTLWWGGGGSSFMVMDWSSGTSFRAFAFDTVSRSATKAAGSGVGVLHHVWWRYDQINLSAFVDDADTAAGANTAMTGAQHANLLAGVFNLGSDSAGPLKGYWMETIVFPTGLAETSRRGLTMYLKGRYPSLVAGDATTALTFGTTSATYDTSTKKFTLANTAGGATVFELLPATGNPSIDRAATVFKDLGYTATDKTGALTYTSDNAAYQSRHWVKADLGSALAITASVALDHNAGTGGTFTLEGNGSDLWTSPAVSQTLTGDSVERSAYFNASSYRWWRLVIDDVQNTAGYSEVGVWSPYTYFSPGAYANIFTKNFTDLTHRGFATHGAAWVDERPQHGGWTILWRNITDADRVLWEAFQDAVPRGKAFFFLFDSADPTGIRYVEHPEPIGIELVPTAGGNLWSVSLVLLESLA